MLMSFAVSFNINIQGQGIGRASCLFLAKEGAKVVKILLFPYGICIIIIFPIDFQVIATDFNNDSLESLRQEAFNENLDIKVIIILVILAF